MVKMNTVELFPDVPSDAPISTSAAFRITHVIAADGNNGSRQEIRAPMGQRRSASGWRLSASGQPTVTCSGGVLFYQLQMRIGIDILEGGLGGAVTNIGNLNPSFLDSFVMELDDYRRRASAPQLLTSRMPRYARRRGVLGVRLVARPVRPRLLDRGGPVQKWKVSLGYDISIAAEFTEAQVGRGNPRSYYSNIEAGMHFFVDQPRL